MSSLQRLIYQLNIAIVAATCTRGCSKETQIRAAVKMIALEFRDDPDPHKLARQFIDAMKTP